MLGDFVTLVDFKSLFIMLVVVVKDFSIIGSVYLCLRSK